MNINLDGNTITNGYFAGSVLEPTPIEIESASTLNIDHALGSLFTCSLYEDTTIAPPTHPTLGARMELWINAAGSDRNLSFDAAIAIPSESTFTNPKLLAENKTYIILLKYNAFGGYWCLASLVGGY